MASMVHVVVTTALFLAVSLTEGRSGCLSFGHSCFGGVAKRQNEQTSYPEEKTNYQNDGNMDSNNDADIWYQPKQSQVLPPPEYEQQLRNIKQWLRNYRDIPNELVQQQ